MHLATDETMKSQMEMLHTLLYCTAALHILDQLECLLTISPEN